MCWWQWPCRWVEFLSNYYITLLLDPIPLDLQSLSSILQTLFSLVYKALNQGSQLSDLQSSLHPDSNKLGVLTLVIITLAPCLPIDCPASLLLIILQPVPLIPLELHSSSLDTTYPLSLVPLSLMSYPQLELVQLPLVYKPPKYYTIVLPQFEYQLSLFYLNSGVQFTPYFSDTSELTLWNTGLCFEEAASELKLKPIWPLTSLISLTNLPHTSEHDLDTMVNRFKDDVKASLHHATEHWGFHHVKVTRQFIQNICTLKIEECHTCLQAAWWVY